MSCDVGEGTERLANEQNFTYVTAHSPTLISLLLRHRLFTYAIWQPPMVLPISVVSILRCLIMLGKEYNACSSNIKKNCLKSADSIDFVRILIIFSCELSLILGVGGKLKKNGSRYLQEDPRYQTQFEQDRSIGLAYTIGDG